MIVFTLLPEDKCLNLGRGIFQKVIENLKKVMEKCTNPVLGL